MRLEALNAASRDEATAAFLLCCGSTRWAGRMADARAFTSVEAVQSTADAIWSTMGPADWLEAFRAHPRIGERPDAAGLSAWSREEQAGAGFASAAVRHRMRALNAEYETRFGFVFIVCATGKSADEMLAILEERLGHDRERELAVAAGEQSKITRIRLTKLFGPDERRQAHE